MRNKKNEMKTMSLLDKFIKDNTPEERGEMLLRTNELLLSLGHHDHELNIDNLASLEGSAETISLLMLIESELLAACKSLLLKYFIVCREQDLLLPYLSLLEFLYYIENTIESSTVVYYYNDELSAEDQLLSWVEVFRPDLEHDIAPLILDVMDTLIENILQIHELKIDVESVEVDEVFLSKLPYIKLLRNVTNKELLPVRLVKDQVIKTTLTVEQITSRFSKSIYSDDTLDSTITPFNLIGFCMLTNNAIETLAHDTKTLCNVLYTDVPKVSGLIHAIDTILSPTGDLCKTMNTI